MTPFSGTKLGRYELVDRIGAGGRGEVWRAHDQELHRDEAVKFQVPRTSRASCATSGRFGPRPEFRKLTERASTPASEETRAS